jgi:hypothetical protein
MEYVIRAGSIAEWHTSALCSACDDISHLFTYGLRCAIGRYSVYTMDNAWECIDRWCSEIDKIRVEVRRLYHWRKWYRRIHEMVKANPSIDKGHPFYDWMFECYVATSCAAVRRLMDKDQRNTPFSIDNLLRDIDSKSLYITRSWFLERYRYQNGQRGSADELYDRYAGAGVDNPEIESLPEVKTARDATKPIVCLVDKMIAHLDRKPPDEKVYLSDLDKAIDAVGDLYKALYLFVWLRSDDDLEPEDAIDWEWLFKESWMESIDGEPLRP